LVLVSKFAYENFQKSRVNLARIFVTSYKMNNQQYLQHVGYVDTNVAISTYFSHSTVSFLSAKITELLKDFYPPGIIVPDKSIIDIMNSVYEGYRPSTGDIYSRYNIPSNENPNCIDEMINQVISIIVPQVKNNLGMDQRNSQLTAWTQVLGTFNAEGLRSHPPIKLLLKRPQTMMFNMNY
jgi:hypothetical protein